MLDKTHHSTSTSTLLHITSSEDQASDDEYARCGRTR